MNRIPAILIIPVLYALVILAAPFVFAALLYERMVIQCRSKDKKEAK